MMLDWGSYRAQLGQRIADLGRPGPDTLRGHRGLGQAGEKAGLLGAKVRALIAIGVAIAVNAGAALVFTSRAMDAVAAAGPAA